jgi:ABC-2 type transport system permease protein
MALGISFFVWIFLLAFIDIALISFMLQNRFNEEFIIALALANPMEIFRVAAISLFDPELTVMGPVAFYILDTVSQPVFVLFSIAYPISLGMLFSYFGYKVFSKRDLV